MPVPSYARSVLFPLRSLVNCEHKKPGMYRTEITDAYARIELDTKADNKGTRHVLFESVRNIGAMDAKEACARHDAENLCYTLSQMWRRSTKDVAVTSVVAFKDDEELMRLNSRITVKLSETDVL